MVQEEGTNPQVGKVTVDEFAASIKEKYPEYKDVDNLKLANAIVEKYPEYKDAVTFEPIAVEPVKKKDGFTPSQSLDGESPSFLSQANTFFQPAYNVADWVNKSIPVWSNWASVINQTVGGITTAIDGLVKEGALYALPEGQEKDDIKKRISETGIDSVIDTPLEGIANMMRDYGQEIKQQRQESYGITIEQQELGVIGNLMSGNYASASKLAIDNMTDGMLQAGLASLTGVAPLAVSAGGEKYYDVSNKPEYSSSERILYSSAVGLVEGLVESVFSGDIKAFSKVLDSDLALKGFQEQLLKAARNTPWYKEFLEMGTEEGLEETLSESFNQVLLGVKEGVRPDPMALGEAFISGFLPGGGTHIVTNGISAIGSEKRTKRRQQLNRQIKEIKDKIETVEDPSQKAILEEMIKGDLNELNKEIGLDAELYAEFSDEDVKEIININTDIRKLYQKIGLAVSSEQKEGYKREILEARSRKLDIENRYSAEPVRYIRDGKLIPKAQFVDMINKATPEEMSTGQWGVENDTEVEQLLASRIPKVDTKEEAAVPSAEQAKPIQEGGVEAPPTAVVTQEDITIEEPTKTEEVAVEEAVVEEPKKTPSIPLDAKIEIQDIVEVKDSEGNPRLFARYPLKDKPIKSFFEIKQEKDGTVKRVSDKLYGPAVKTLKKRLAKEVPSSKVKEQLSKETKTEELEIILLDEQGARKKLTQTALSDPRNIQKGKMTVEYSDKGLTFKTKSETGRMKENGGELFVSNKEIESIPNINKYEKGTKEYAFQVAGVIGIADQYKGDPIKLMKDSFVKPQDIGKEGTPSAKRFTPAQGEKLSNMVGNFNKIVKKIGASPVKIVFVNSPAEFKQYYEYTTGSKKETLSKASYLPLQKEIIVDLSKADMTTLAHEMLHAYVSAVKLDRKKVTLFTGIIEAELLKGSDAEVKLAKELADFRNEYIKQDVYGKGRTKEDAIIAEEFLAEYVGMMSAYADELSPAKQVSFADKIRAAVVKFLAKIGVVDKSLTVKIQNREDALNFINGFVDALQGRTEVTADTEVQVEEQGESGEVGTIGIPRQQIEVIDAPKSSEDSRSWIRKFVTDIDVNKLSGRKFVTNMYDYTSAGITQLGNGLSINLLGGRNYVPFIMERTGKEIGDVSNLAAFNTKAQAEGFVRNAKSGEADLFAPHSGTLDGSWQFQHHIFAELVDLVLENKILGKSELIEMFNTGLNTKGINGGIKGLETFNKNNGTKLKNLSSFKKDPLKLVELLNAENNYSPNLRKIFNQKIASNKKFQKAIGVKNLNEFQNKISDPLNAGVSGGEIMTFIEFDPNTFKIVKTKAGDLDHHPSFGWAVKAKIKRILQPTKFYKSYDLTKTYTKYNSDKTILSRDTDEGFAKSNVSSSAGAIPKVAKVETRDQIDWQPSLFGKGKVNPAIVNRTTDVQEAAVDLLQGKITNAEYQEIVRITQPIEAITKFFLPASTKDMKESIDRKKGQLLNTPLKDGQPIGLRLDIPAYKNRNIWVVAIHDKGGSGKSLSYGSVAWATNVQFGSNPKVAAFIAAGKNMDTLEKQNKSTIARMLGEWKNFEGKTKEEKDASAVKKVDEIVAIENSYPGTSRKGSPWRQIGMNPFRHSFFYDRRTGQPVVAAAEVVQIGGLVYAKDVVYADKNDPIFNVEGYKDANGETVRFQLEDQESNEKNNEETYSAVEDNQEGLFDAGVDELVDAEVSNADSWKERPRTSFEKFIDLTRLKIQDSFRKVIRVQEDVEYSSGKPVGLDQDFRNAEALMHGKAKEELNKTDKKVADIAAKIKSSGLSVEQFNELLYAMHAQERNRFLRVISTDVGGSLMAMRKKLGIKPSEVAELLGISNQEYYDIEANKEALETGKLSDILLIYGTTPSRFFYDNAKVKEGSGMTDVEARKILANYNLNLASPDVSQLSTKVRVAVESVRSLMQDTRNVLLESGLETQATIDAFESTYKNYVPLRGFADSDIDSEILEGGRKLEVRGREKRAKGRETKADSPLTQIIVSNTTNIVRGEKNRVMNKFYNLAVNNPNKDVYEIVDPKLTKEYKRDIRDGKIVTTAKTISDYLLDPNMVSVRVNGDYKFIRFKDASLAEALRGANVVKAQWMVKYLGAFNRTLSSFITTYDPEFILRNFSRDIQTAVLNLYAEQEMTAGLIKDKNIVAKVVADTFPALKSILAVEGGLSGKKTESSDKEMDQYYREFKEDGARTEWFYSKSSDEVQKDIEKLITGKKDTALKAAGNLIERINSSVENAVRLSSYVNARKAGVSRAKSAELAKNLTVNFNKSGEWGQIANTLFLFFNASVQGISRLSRTLKPNYTTDSEGNRTLRITTAQKMAVGLMLLGSIMSLLNEGLSDDDEDDGESFYSKIPDFEKERNFIIMKPNGRDYFKIPLPYGVNVFYVAGTLIADASQKIKTPGEAAGGIMQAALGSFSPINFPNSDDTINFFEKFITPTIGQVPLALAINENYFGQTIYNENFPFDASPKPESELGKKSGNRWTKELTKFLNKVSGGSEFRGGEIDINPDKIDFVMESYSGGMGKFIGRSSNVVDKIITGNWDQLEPRQIPGVRVFYGQVSKYANFQEFYSRSILVNQMQEEVKNKIILGPESKRVSKMFYLGKNTRKQLSNLKKREDFVMKIKDPEIQKDKMEKLEKLRYKLVADYNKQYEKFEIDKIK